MLELLRTNDLVLISWITSILSDEGVEIIVLDNNMSVLEGSALAIPRRIMVYKYDYTRAKIILEKAVQERAENNEYLE